MADPVIRLKRSAVAGKRPTLANLELGEVALNTYDGNLFTRQDTSGVGIGTTVTLLTPWQESYGGQSISYTGDVGIIGSVGIGTTNAERKLTVHGDVYFLNNALIASYLPPSNIDHIWHTDASSLPGSAGQWHFVSDGSYKRNGNSTLYAGSVYLAESGQQNYLAGFTGVGASNPTSMLTVTGDVLVSGVCTATDFDSTSDLTLKDNIRKISKPISKIEKIRGVTFEWKETGQKAMGVVAQEIEKVLPSLVRGDEIKTVNYNGLIGLLIECVKDQQKQINDLREQLNK